MSGSGKNPFSYKDTVAYKWGEALLDEGFVPFPKRLLKCATQVFKGDLRMSELAALLAIVDYQRPQVTRKPSLNHLASAAGLSDSRFRRCLQTLESRGLLEWSGTENGMEFNYEGLRRRVMKLTAKMEDSPRNETKDDDDDNKKSRR
jgi:hypothetical protein